MSQLVTDGRFDARAVQQIVTGVEGRMPIIPEIALRGLRSLRRKFCICCGLHSICSA
jgi:hypothetical protein